jgi:hypothetical protein
MKKFFSVTAIVGVVMIAAIGASAAPNTGPGDTTGQPAVNQPQIITGENDQRLYTNNMNALQRLAVQQAVKKRALAKRNELLREAAQEEETQAGTKVPAQPGTN